MLKCSTKSVCVSHTTTFGVTSCTTSCLIGPLRVCQFLYVVVLMVVVLGTKRLQTTKVKFYLLPRSHTEEVKRFPPSPGSVSLIWHEANADSTQFAYPSASVGGLPN